jgi:hypothetical protein
VISTEDRLSAGLSIARKHPFAVAVCVHIVLGDAYRIFRVRSNAGTSIVLSVPQGIH